MFLQTKGFDKQDPAFVSPIPSPHKPLRLPFSPTRSTTSVADVAGRGFLQQHPLQNIPPPKLKKAKGPKGYVSGFNFFAVHTRSRDDVQHKFKSLTNNQVNKIIGQLWKDLPTSERAVFFQLAEDDKLRYLRDVHEFNEKNGTNLVPKIDPPPGYDICGNPLQDDVNVPEAGVERHDNDSRMVGTGTMKRTRAGKKSQRSGSLRNVTTVQRPRTSYSLFAHQEKDFLAGLKCPDLQRRMGKYLGMRWKNMRPAEKRMYDLLEASGATINKKPRL